MGKFDGVLLVSDLDGTLLRADQKIGQKNREAIQRFTAEGGTFTYVTGRSLNGLQPVFRKLIPDSPVGCFNGGGIFDPKSDAYVWKVPLDPEAEELTNFVYSQFPDAGIELCGFREAWFMRSNALTEAHRRIEEVPDVRAAYCDVAEYMAKVLLIIKSDRLDALANALAGHPLAERFNFVQSSPEYYEILPKGSSKGNLVIRLAELLGIDRTGIVAVGDNHNDVSMLEAAAYGVAVANATSHAKNAADLVLDHTNEEDAIAELIERMEMKLPF